MNIWATSWITVYLLAWIKLKKYNFQPASSLIDSVHVCASVQVCVVCCVCIYSMVLSSAFLSFPQSYFSETESMFWKASPHISIEVDYFFRGCDFCSHLNGFLLKKWQQIILTLSHKSVMELVITPQVLSISLHFHFKWQDGTMLLPLLQLLLLYGYEKPATMFEENKTVECE